MEQIKKLIYAAVCLVTVVLIYVLPGQSRQNYHPVTTTTVVKKVSGEKPVQPTINSRAAIMMDADTGQIIYQQNSQQKLPVASVSKLLTVCVIEDEIHHHQLSWNKKVKISQDIAAISNNPSYSAIGLQAGQSYTVRELFNATLIKSADGAALALATANGDSIAQFNAKMVKKAAQMGVHNITIVNSVGLRDGDLGSLNQKKIDDSLENMLSARDVALISRYLIQHYPDVLQVTKQPTATFTIAPGQSKTVENLNQMLSGKTYAMADTTIDGLKTGTSDAAGACFASSGLYHGHRIITVVLHANGGSDNRFAQTQSLYNYLKQNVHQVTLPIKEERTVTQGQSKKLAVVPQKVTVWQTKKQAHYRLKVRRSKKNCNRKGEVVAPVKRHQRLGSVTITSPDIKTVDNQPLTVPLRAQKAVKRGNFWQRVFSE